MNIPDLIYTVIAETFEGLAFLELTPAEESSESFFSLEETSVWASISLLEPVKGRISVVLPKSLILEIASSLYSIDDAAVLETKVDDLIGEIGNTFAGRFVGQYLGTEKTFALGMPNCGKGLPAEKDALRCGFLTDDERRILVYVKID